MDVEDYESFDKFIHGGMGRNPKDFVWPTRIDPLLIPSGGPNPAVKELLRIASNEMLGAKLQGNPVKASKLLNKEILFVEWNEERTHQTYLTEDLQKIPPDRSRVLEAIVIPIFHKDEIIALREEENSGGR